MSAATKTHHETARLFFMEKGGIEPRPSVAEFSRWMKAEHPDVSAAVQIQLWQDYMGTRPGPVFDYVTGRPL